MLLYLPVSTRACTASACEPMAGGALEALDRPVVQLREGEREVNGSRNVEEGKEQDAGASVSCLLPRDHLSEPGEAEGQR